MSSCRPVTAIRKGPDQYDDVPTTHRHSSRSRYGPADQYRVKRSEMSGHCCPFIPG
ncbi:hypothetical protein BV133_276 [Blastochloris viridis]|uniref:Uncharacterized protein n=1 Tax=Blastochloris viridis TaxID=1079 RepID=A0A182CXI3_BLAVI|nr:hypothetical protein BV133_276 [Blastochloris viridis]